MAQLSYGYKTPKGVAGGLLDISPYSVDSRLNGELTPDTLKFGMGVVQGATPGADVKLPMNTDTADKFEGLVLTSFTQEMNMAGDVKLYPKQTVGVLRYGKAWARIIGGITVQYGDPLYLIAATGGEIGKFTNDGTGDVIEVSGRFIGPADSSDIAPIEIYNQSSSAASNIAALDARVTALEL
jgi:hypothetical protein